MTPAVTAAIEELRAQFVDNEITTSDDGAGGAYFMIHNVMIGPKYEPQTTWLGGRIVEGYPYADIYPVFIDGNVKRVDGQPFSAPVTTGHSWQNRPAIQISRANRNVQVAPQTARSKVLKVIHFLEALP
jgi:hypothetical protein